MHIELAQNLRLLAVDIPMDHLIVEAAGQYAIAGGVNPNRPDRPAVADKIARPLGAFLARLLRGTGLLHGTAIRPRLRRVWRTHRGSAKQCHQPESGLQRSRGTAAEHSVDHAEIRHPSRLQSEAGTAVAACAKDPWPLRAPRFRYSAGAAAAPDFFFLPFACSASLVSLTQIE
jgi:hypothetical protein